MQRSFRFSSLVPSGLTVESVTCVDETIIVKARAQGEIANCPLCKTASRRVHSRYSREASDLPCAGRRVRLSLCVRRFHCEAAHCRRRIFAERFDESVLGERSRRTARLDHIVHHLGLALGGRPAASFARRLLLPVSNDTLLRVVRKRARRRAEAPRVVGVDDWAFRRNHRYGSLICDLERRQVVALLPDREIATVAAWLADHPGIEILSRDRGGGYGEAATQALPRAVQVADRWHLMENASAAFLDSVRKSMRAIRAAIGATAVDPESLTCAERLQYQGYLRREETNAAILALAKAGAPIKQIARQTGHSRKLVRSVLRGGRADVFRVRHSTLEAYLPFLEAQWAAGCRNGAELWRRAKTQGFRGSSRVVGEWATRRRKGEMAGDEGLRNTPAARTIARLMTTARDHLSKPEAVIVAAIETRVPTLVEARELVGRFQQMIRKKAGCELDPWIVDARQSLVASFVRGVVKDRAAVRAAIASRWSNGQTEGQITKLKLVKRQMYGRAKLDLLEARLLGVA